MSALDWQPTQGATVHLASGNAWALPTGRYTLAHHGGGAFDLVQITTGEALAVNADLLTNAESAGLLFPISAAEVDRDRQVLALTLAAPMRARAGRQLVAQFDCSGLALFGAADQPSLL